MKESLAEQAYQAIRKDILTCALAPGSQIAQSELVSRYELGITPIREALKRCEHEGYVRSIPRFGYMVTSFSLRDVENLYDLRLTLEDMAVRQAILRASNEQIEQIQVMADFTYVYQNAETYLHFLEENTAFHRAVGMASGNKRLAELLTEILSEMTRIFHLGLELRDSAEEMHREHVALAEALRTRDTALAVKINTEQILNSRTRVLEYMSKHLDFRIPTGA